MSAFEEKFPSVQESRRINREADMKLGLFSFGTGNDDISKSEAMAFCLDKKVVKKGIKKIVDKCEPRANGLERALFKELGIK